MNEREKEGKWVVDDPAAVVQLEIRRPGVERDGREKGVVQRECDG